MDEKASQNQKKPRKIKPVGADGHRSRMFTKFLNTDTRNMMPRDIIEMLLFFSVRMRDTRDSAVYLMEHFGGDMYKLLNASPEELTEIEGVGPSSATLLNVVGQIAGKLNNPEPDTRPVYKDFDEIGELFAKMYDAPQSDELFIAVFDGAMHASVRRYKTDSYAIDTDDVYNFIKMCSQSNSATMALAHFTAIKGAMPSKTDIDNVKRIESLLAGTDFHMLEYYIVNGDTPMQVKYLLY